jgi:O-antigen/teichoic acid export membrane protein
MTANTHYVYVALGYTRLATVLSAIGLATMVVLAPIGGAVIGLPGVGGAYVAATGIQIPINYYMLRRLVGIRFLDLWRRVWRSVFAALAMLGIILVVFSGSQPSGVGAALGTFLTKVLLGVLSYISALALVWRLCGRPDGPERTVLVVLAGRLANLRHRFRRDADADGE